MDRPVRVTRRRALTGIAGAVGALVTTGVAAGVARPAGGTGSTADTRFTLAVIPDTQNEVAFRLGDKWFEQRTRWLVANAGALNLAFVTHTGDVVNWDRIDPDTIYHDQYVRASDALQVLQDGGVPYSLSIGNHDAAATCEGGSACPGDAHVNLRNTSSFNQFFPASRFASLGGVYEQGKVDNSFHTFNAGGLDWLVVNLELYPRTGAVDWAKQVVGDHPAHNVAIATHSHLAGDGTISQSKEYGDNSPQYVFDNLISRYANVRFVFCGHVGLHGRRVDTGVHGNRIHQILGTYHDIVSTRLIEIDTAGNSFSTRVFNHETGRDHTDGSAFSADGLDWVRPARRLT